MMMDLDSDLDMHTMRDNLPGEEDDGDCDSVQWKSSQTTNRALDSLMLEAQQNAIKASTPRETGWSWGSPGASTSRTISAPTLAFQSAATSADPAPPTTSRRRVRGAHNGRTQSFTASMDIELGLAGAGAGSGSSFPDPAQFLKLLKGVSKQADENAGIRAAGADASNTRVRQGVKQRTMGVRRERASSSFAGSSSGLTKGKEREHRPPLSRTSSVTSSASPSSVVSISSPESNYSFMSADTSMTTPEPDDHLASGIGARHNHIGWPTPELMPPPPVPQARLQNRLPALDVCPPRPAPSQQPLLLPPSRPAPVSPSASRSGAARETRMHPLLQKPKSATTTASSHTHTPSYAPVPARTTLPPPPPPQPTYSQSQPQRRGPPVLGMRRINTAPLAKSGGMSMGSAQASQGPKKFRPPLLNGGVQVKTEPGGVAVVPAQMQKQAQRPHPQAVKTEPGVVVKREYPSPAPRPAYNPPPAPAPVPVQRPVPAYTAPAQAPSTPAHPTPSAGTGVGFSSPSVDEMFDEGSSFDMDAMERVLKGYDDLDLQALNGDAVHAVAASGGAAPRI
ncbi:hypothetical protein C8R46DRAFT_1093463, partial [Mycena filopes]